MIQRQGPVRLDAQPFIKETPAASPPKRWIREVRVSTTADQLELMIAKAVNAAPGCEAFVGVIVERTTPKSCLDANWELRGIRFGGMDRQIAREALTPIVQRLQQKFRLA
jgi:hypothetical protein